MTAKVVIGMSGGVDSSVSAYLLKKEGYDVIGVTMRIWQDEVNIREGGCCSLSAVEDARRVAERLDIPYYVMNFKDIFKEKVIDYFVDEYLHGRTPNPCIACNKYIKFDALLLRARELGAEYVATGHYAKISFDDKLQKHIIKDARDQTKDQTYVLYNFTQDQLSHTLMPLGDYKKSEVREIARGLDLVVADKPESQEICFVEDNDYGKFVDQAAPDSVKEGYFTDMSGKILGKHRGITHYTIGQRRGLNISSNKRLYVVNIDTKDDNIVLGENGDLYRSTLTADNLNFIPFDTLDREMRVSAKIRYNAPKAEATVKPCSGGKIVVNFDEPQRAITPGQAVVLYDGDMLLGGGTIL